MTMNNCNNPKPDFHMIALKKSECAKDAGELTVVRLGYVTQLLEEVYQSYHHQLQKARHDWLREEIVRLEGMKIKESHIGIGGLYTSQVQMEVNQALQTIINRYHSELDQPTLEDKE